MRMGRRIAATLKRTAIHAGPTVLGIIVLDFLFLQLMPGDVADVMAIEAGSATAETMAMMRERFGLDQPMLTPARELPRPSRAVSIWAIRRASTPR